MLNDIFTRREKIILVFAIIVGIIFSTASYELRAALEIPTLCISAPLIIYAGLDPERKSS